MSLEKTKLEALRVLIGRMTRLLQRPDFAGLETEDMIAFAAQVIDLLLSRRDTAGEEAEAVVARWEEPYLAPQRPPLLYGHQRLALVVALRKYLHARLSRAAATSVWTCTDCGRPFASLTEERRHHDQGLCRAPFKPGDRVRIKYARARDVKNDETLTGVVEALRPGGFVLVKDSEGDSTLWRPESLVWDSARPNVAGPVEICGAFDEDAKTKVARQCHLPPGHAGDHQETQGGVTDSWPQRTADDQRLRMAAHQPCGHPWADQHEGGLCVVCSTPDGTEPRSASAPTESARDVVAKAHGWSSWAEVLRSAARDGYTTAGGRGALAGIIAKEAASARSLVYHVDEHGPATGDRRSASAPVTGELPYEDPTAAFLAAYDAGKQRIEPNDAYERWAKSHVRVPGSAPAAPIPMVLHCPECRARHIDEGDFATKPHHTHSCQSCGLTWRPSVVATVGVQFLPGFKNDAPCTGSPAQSAAYWETRCRTAWALLKELTGKVVDLDAAVAGAECGALLYQGGVKYRCEAPEGHAGPHLDVHGEVFSWTDEAKP